MESVGQLAAEGWGFEEHCDHTKELQTNINAMEGN